MSRKTLVSDIMTHKVVCAGLNNTLSQVLDFFTKFKIQHLPVTDQNRIVGIISVNDLLRFMNTHLKKSESISQRYLNNEFSLENIMTKNPVTLSPEASIEEAFELVAPGNFQCILVAKDSIIQGIITNKDLVKYHVKGFNTNHENYTISTPGYGI